MGAIEDARNRLLESDLVQHPVSRTRSAWDIIDECLAPLAAELEAMDAECARRGEVMTRQAAELDAAREAVEGWQILHRLSDVQIERWGMSSRPVTICAYLTDDSGRSRVFHGNDLLAALRAAEAAKTEQEKRDD